MLDKLPEDIQNQLMHNLSQADHASIAELNTSLNAVAAPYLHRIYHCVSCSHHLFHPRLRRFNLIDRRMTQTRGITSKLPSRVFFQLILDSPFDLHETGIVVDAKPGVPNFHVLRHLAQTECREGFPDVLKEVRALRCAACNVFVGFRYGVDYATSSQPRNDSNQLLSGDTASPTQSAPFATLKYFVHQDFVELIDGCGTPISISGQTIPPPETSIRCATPSCHALLFDRGDMLPWSHVLSSSRLTDLDAYLEWDHSWSGAANAHQPAFFVKRLHQGCWKLGNVRQERLRQGDMVVGDVFCIRCNLQIGWKFVGEVGANVVNYDQVGRFGIIRGACTPSEPRNVV